MLFLFYFLAICTIMFTILSLIQINAVYSLFYFSISILNTALIFFLLGNYLIGSFHIIIYSGAIIVLFIFMIMMLNLDQEIQRKYIFNNNYYYSFVSIVMMTLILIFWNQILFFLKDTFFVLQLFNLKVLGISLFSSYLFLVELLSIFLLSSLITILLVFKSKNILHYSVLNTKQDK